METSPGLFEVVAHFYLSEKKRLRYLNFLKKCVCVCVYNIWLTFFCSLIFFPFSSFFLVEALYPLSSKAKLETHETIFVAILGKDTNENKNSSAPRQITFVQIPSVGWRQGGRFTCGYSTGRGVLICTKKN